MTVLQATDEAMQRIGVVFIRFASIRAYRLETQFLAVDLVADAVGMLAQLGRQRGDDLEVPLEPRAKICDVEWKQFSPRLVRAAVRALSQHLGAKHVAPQ